MSSRQAEALRVQVQSDARVEVQGAGVTLVLTPEDGQVAVAVFDGGLLLGRMLVAPDGVEVVQAAKLHGVLVEWEA